MTYNEFLNYIEESFSDTLPVIVNYNLQKGKTKIYWKMYMKLLMEVTQFAESSKEFLKIWKNTVKIIDDVSSKNYEYNDIIVFAISPFICEDNYLFYDTFLKNKSANKYSLIQDCFPKIYALKINHIKSNNTYITQLTLKNIRSAFMNKFS